MIGSEERCGTFVASHVLPSASRIEGGKYRVRIKLVMHGSKSAARIVDHKWLTVEHAKSKIKLLLTVSCSMSFERNIHTSWLTRKANGFSQYGGWLNKESPFLTGRAMNRVRFYVK